MASLPVHIEFVTRAYKRPKMLQVCTESVRTQTYPASQYIIHDKVGIGVSAAQLLFRQHEKYVSGDYICILDDDNRLAHNKVVEILTKAIRDYDNPDLLICRYDRSGYGVVPPPELFGQAPVRAQIDAGCIVAKRKIWRQAVYSFQPAYDGDYPYCLAAWKMARRAYYLDEVIIVTQKVSNGAPEED